MQTALAFLTPRPSGKQEVAASVVRPVHGQKEKKKKGKKKRIFAKNPLGFSVNAKTFKTGTLVNYLEHLRSSKK